ncbi:MAG: hypothetical protein R3D02_15570 [Hyphomicrobiales bacterium]
MTGKFARLEDRGIVAVSGAEAGHFLQGLQTANIDRVAETGSGFGALLTPQGKILFDFLILHVDGLFLIDLPLDSVAEFAKRLGFYKLRAKVEIAARSDLVVLAGFDGPAPTGVVAAASDPRLAALGWRAVAEAACSGRPDGDRGRRLAGAPDRAWRAGSAAGLRLWRRLSA